MVDWRKVLLGTATDVENEFDRLKTRLMRHLRAKPIMILPYIGHGTRQQLYLRGRVMEDRGISSPKDNDTVWQNLVNTYKRLESNELRYATVRARFGSHTTEVKTNEEGYFEVNIEPDRELPEDQIFYDIDLELIDFPARAHDLSPIKETGRVIVPPPDAQFAIVSDIDDTVIRTDVLNILKMARNTFLRNSRTRLPFTGVAAFYRALQAGTKNTYNPIFYVSSSPWNLYDMIVDFFDVRNIPIGPLFLKDLGLTREHLIDSGHDKHKTGNIQKLLNTHPALPFVLIGDSSQHDPSIYLDIIRHNPGRVKAVYIRNVSLEEQRSSQIQAYADEAANLGTEMLLVNDTVAAAEHAALSGLIRQEELMAIRLERTEDEKEPEPLEKLIDPDTDRDQVGQDQDPTAS
jgi:phosphatidate phosphatase APP1